MYTTENVYFFARKKLAVESAVVQPKIMVGNMISNERKEALLVFLWLKQFFSLLQFIFRKLIELVLLNMIFVILKTNNFNQCPVFQSALKLLYIIQ